MNYEIFLIDRKPFVSYKFLFKKGVPKQTVYNNTSAGGKGKWFTIKHPSSFKEKLIDYCTIPSEVIAKYKLPLHEEMVQKARVIEAKRKALIGKKNLWHYRSRALFFYLKQVTAFIGIVLLIILFVVAIFS